LEYEPWCQGACLHTHNGHKGEIKQVQIWYDVKDCGLFWYCENAIEENIKRGFVVEDIINE
jgi:hypothetical protein